jgi:hypothetical protein
MPEPEKSVGDDAAARAAEALERLKLRCTDALERIRAQATAGEATAVEAGVKALYDTMREPSLPRDFVGHIRAELKGLDLMVNMKATDMALRRAVAHAQADRKLERNQEVGAARIFLSRAIAAGANDDFKHAAEMTIESAMLTGGVRQSGPTRAKPADEVPPPRSLAKGERREFRRYEAPVLTVTVGDKSFTTLDWSMGGMLVGGSTVDEFPSGDPVQIELAGPGADHPIHVSVIAVRVEIRKGGIAVRFFQVTPELSGLLRRAILQRGAG